VACRASQAPKKPEKKPGPAYYLVSQNYTANKMLNTIRTGDPDAAADWLQTFLPGTCFLIRRRLGKPDVEPEARSVIEAALQAVQADGSVTAEQFPGLIRRLITQRFPEKSREYTVSSSAAIKAAERTLNKMSALERDALRRCYVLGEAPESIVSGLRLTLEEFRKIQSRARAGFSTAKAKQANVA
jgi:DNA-directed RNA polymerase specialized sigma24 family protein